MNQEGTRPAKSNPPGPPAKTETDLNQIVQRLVHLLQHEYHRYKITVILDLEPKLPRTTAEQEIECVVLALFTRSRNAIVEAERGYGTIMIRTRLMAGKIQLSITDDGVAGPRSGESEAIWTLRDDLHLTAWAEIVQDQAGELYAWVPRHLALTTIFMNLPVAL